jgi:hypothetical protein
MPERLFGKKTDLLEAKLLRFFGLTDAHYYWSYAQM